MANIGKFPSQIEKDLFIVDQGINEDGLTISYIYNGKELEISLDQYDAAELLTKFGVVAACDDDGKVLVEDEGGEMIWQYWHVFVRANNLSEREAFHLAVAHESEKSMQVAVNNIREIPSLFEQMANVCKVHAKVVYGIDLDPSKPAI